MKKEGYEFDKWKDFILSVIIEKEGSTLTDYVWDRLKKQFNLTSGDKSYYVYTDSVLPCLENEFQLVRTSGKRGIHITEKGKHVAKIGYRSYINSLKRHEFLHRMNDYLSVTTGILSVVTALISLANLYFGWMEKIMSFIPSILLVIMFVVFRLTYKSK